MEKLRETNVAGFFKAQVGGKFAAQNLVECNVNALLGHIKEVLLTPVEKVFGHPKVKKLPWVIKKFLIFAETAEP